MADIKLTLNVDDVNFVEEREKMLTRVAEIFDLNSEVVERARLHRNGVAWESVRVQKDTKMTEGHEGCEDLEMEESACGWGHVLTSENPRKVKGFRVSPEAFLLALTTQRIDDLSWTKVTRGIPPGARSLGATYELASRCWIVYIEHDSFPEIDTGVRAPLCEIVFHQMDFEGLITRLGEVLWVVGQRIEDTELAEKIRPLIQEIMKLYFPEETLRKVTKL